jgi:dUTP pyrophosphatase
MNRRLPFLVRRLNSDALMPCKGSKSAAGYDLHACEDTVVPAEGKAIIHTGIAFRTPPNTYGRIAPRSGLAAKHHIQVGAGVIDEDYRGEVCVVLFNHAKTDFNVSKHDRIAQVIIEKI